MSKKVKVVLNREGVRQLLKSNAMMSACTEEAKKILNKCGPGYDMDTHVGKNRVNAMVYARTYQAKKDNLDNNTILKAVGQ